MYCNNHRRGQTQFTLQFSMYLNACKARALLWTSATYLSGSSKLLLVSTTRLQ
uniref:Uncharacterized protein n=1 Tax=Anguilla anguilla TaxID=7936 RepID=A0A0E9PSQ5_ANGAN